MSWILSIFHIGILFTIVFLLYKRQRKENVKLYWIAFGYRVMMSLSVGLIYVFYYTVNDTWTYFHDAETLARLASANFSTYLGALFDSDSAIANYVIITNEEWRSVFFIKLLSVLCLITGNSYWISSIYISLISFFASWYLYLTMRKWKPDAFGASALAFLFFPSVVFWGSGIEKESLAISGIFVIVAGIIRFWSDRNMKFFSWLWLLLSIFIVWKLRYFWLAVLVLVSVPCLIIMYLLKKESGKIKITLLASISLLIVPVLIFFIHPNFDPAVFLDVLVQNNRQFVAISRPENVIHYHQLTPDWGSVIINSPWALLSGLFRPFLWETTGLLSFFASIENLFLLLMTFVALPSFSRAAKSKDVILLAGALIYIGTLCIFLALSTPNFGSLSRYRIGFLPFFAYIVCYRNPWMTRLQEIFYPKGRQ